MKKEYTYSSLDCCDPSIGFWVEVLSKEKIDGVPTDYKCLVRDINTGQEFYLFRDEDEIVIKHEHEIDNNCNKMLNDILQEVTTSSLDFKVGGPFGAVIYKNGKIVGRGVNRVIGNNDPTAHAEIEAIRNACRNLKTHNLEGCVIYATGFPCPMCMSAIIWANIKKVYYSADYKDAENIGFRDNLVYKFIKEGQKDQNVLEIEQIDKENIVKLYKEYKESEVELY